MPTRSRPKKKTQSVAAETALPAFGWRNVRALCLLVIATAIAFSPVFSNSFIDYDDPVYITGNPHIQAGLTFDTWKWAWISLEAGNWHPLTWISHALDVDMFGMNAAGHHGISLLIHVLNAILLYLLLWHATRKEGCSLLVAALFALHPLAVESISWAAERKNVLCTFFFLLALAAYGWYAKRPGAGRYLCVVTAFALGLTAKPMVITLPLALLLLDFWPLGRVEHFSFPNPALQLPQAPVAKLVLEKLPLLLLSAASGIVTVIAQSASGAVTSVTALPLSARFANAFYSYSSYILKVFWPLKLVPFYPHVPLSALQVGVAFLILAAVSALVWWQRATRPYLIVGWLFYLGTLLPVIGIVQVGSQAMADRYTYIPMIGVFVMVVWLSDQVTAMNGIPVLWRVIAATLVLVWLAALTWRQAQNWHDSVRLWSYNLEITKNNVVAEDNLGLALIQNGDPAAAIPHFYRAAQLDPKDAISEVNVATDLLAHGQTQEAIKKYEASLAQAAFVPMLLPNIHSNLGYAYLSLGDLDRARNHYKLAIQLNPGDQAARAGLRKIEQLSGTAAPAK